MTSGGGRWVAARPGTQATRAARFVINSSTRAAALTRRSHDGCAAVTEMRGLQPNLRVMSSRADLHCHSTASSVSKLGVQRALGLPECATPPEEVYELAKRRGMDFVTITDHDTIDGVLEIADRPDVFVSEELTARFARRAAGGARPLLRDHARTTTSGCRRTPATSRPAPTYLHENEIACALAHPFYAVAAPLTARHRRRLARAVPDLGGAQRRPRARAEQPAAIYVETHGGTGIGGSDDHAGVDIGRTWSPRRRPPPRRRSFCATCARARARRRRTGQRGQVGARGDGARRPRARPRRRREAPPDPARRAADRRARDVARATRARARSAPTSARRTRRALLRRLAALGRARRCTRRELLALLQADGFSPRATSAGAPAARTSAACAARSTAAPSPTGRCERLGAGRSALFEACVAGDPLRARHRVPRRARRRSCAAARASRARVALIADGIGAMHGVTHTIERDPRARRARLRGRGDRHGRRASTGGCRAVAEIEMPFYAGHAASASRPARAWSRRSPRAATTSSTSRRPGPAGVAAALARAGSLGCRSPAATTPSSAAYAGLRSGDRGRSSAVQAALGALLRRCPWCSRRVPAADASLAELGIDAGADRPLGPRRRPRPLRPGRRDRERAARARSRPLRGPADAREGRRPARRRVPRRPRERTRACTCCSPAAAPRRTDCATRLGEPPPSSAGSRRGAARPTPAPTSSSSARSTDTFGQVILEARRQRAAGRRGRRRRPRGADRRRPHRPVCPPAPAARGGRDRARRLARRSRGAWPAPPSDAVSGRSWEAALERLAAGWRAGAGARRPRRPRRLAHRASQRCINGARACARAAPACERRDRLRSARAADPARHQAPPARRAARRRSPASGCSRGCATGRGRKLTPRRLPGGLRQVDAAGGVARAESSRAAGRRG